MGVGGGGGAVNHDGYPGALYDLQKDVLIPQQFEQAELAQLAQLAQIQAGSASNVTDAVFRDIEDLQRSARSQELAKGQLEKATSDLTELERSLFTGALNIPQASSAGNLAELAAAVQSQLSAVGGAKPQPKQFKSRTTSSTIRPGTPEYASALDAALRRKPQNPRTSLKNRKFRPSYVSYGNDGGARPTTQGVINYNSRFRNQHAQSSIQDIADRYLAQQNALAESQRKFQSQQLALQRLSLFQEQFAQRQALAQQAEQFRLEQIQRSQAYNRYLNEQKAANEALAAQQQNIAELEKTSQLRSNLAQQKVEKTAARLQGMAQNRQAVRQKQSASVSAPLGSRDRALGLFGTRREPR